MEGKYTLRVETEGVEEAKEYLIDLSYKLGTTAIEELTLKDGEKMRKAIEALEMTERSEE